MKHKRMFIIFACLVIMTGALIRLMKSSDAVLVECERPTISSIERAIPINGKIRPVNSVSIAPEVSGEIVEINYAEGDTVLMDNVVVKIKPDLYITLVERAEATLGAAISRKELQLIEFNQAKKNFDRSIELYNHGNISLEEMEQTEKEYQTATAQLSSCNYDVKNAEAGLKEAQENLLKTSIRAPISGTVTRMAVKSGERVVGTSQMAGTDMFQISDLRKMELIVSLNENDIPKIKEKDSVTIKADAFPERQYHGFVDKIANSSKIIGTNIEQVSTFEVRIAIDNHPVSSDTEANKSGLLPGMSASGSIITEIREDVRTIPANAVFMKDRQEYVWIVNANGLAELRKITSGIRNLYKVEIINGVDDKDLIITAPYSAINNLTEGVKVKVVNE